MESHAKILFAMAILVGMSQIEGQCPCLAVSEQKMKSHRFYDECKTAGTFKSNSVCYNDGKQIYPPYEFYSCLPYEDSYLLYQQKCPTPYVIVLDPILGFKFFNSYNPSSGKCDLVPRSQDVAPPMNPVPLQPC